MLFKKKHASAPGAPEAKRNDKITFMIMAGPETKVKDIRFTAKEMKLAIAVFAFVMVLLGVGGTLFFQTYSNNLAKIWTLTQENQQLAENNTAQESEIQELQQMAQTMKDTLNEIQSASEEVKAAVGIEENTANSEVSIEGMVISRTVNSAILSNSTSGTEYANYSGTDVGFEMDNLDDLRASLEEMDNLISSQAESMSALASDVDVTLYNQNSYPDYWPCEGVITSPFGWRTDPIAGGKEFHTGIDIANSKGTEIYAAGAGIVTFAGYKSGWGNMVLVSHGSGLVTQYAHCSEILVSEGDEVKKSDLIAKMGSTGRSTGNHLHFGVDKDGDWMDPQDVLALENQ